MPRKAWRDANLPLAAEIQRRYTLKRKYGMTPEEHSALAEAQRGLCAICGLEETSTYRGKVRELAQDHNHQSGLNRSLLCARCNPMLGYARESAATLRAAADYLEGWVEIHEDRGSRDVGLTTS